MSIRFPGFIPSRRQSQIGANASGSSQSVCHVALNCKNAPVRARYCSLLGLPHFPCYPDHLVTEDALGTRICWPRWSDNADFNRYWRPSACFRQAARKVRQTLVHGEEDDVIPISSARRLFALANEPKTFVSVPGGGHLVLERADVFLRMCEWIDEKILVSRS